MKIKYGSPYFQGGVLRVCKWKIIDDHPLHTDFKIATLQIKQDFVENSRIIQVEKKHNPLVVKKYLTK
jgi:hypothetical protein